MAAATVYQSVTTELPVDTAWPINWFCQGLPLLKRPFAGHLKAHRL